MDWTWDSLAAAVSGTTGARWRIEVAGATPASGTLGKATVVVPPVGLLAITDLRADPATISPNADGVSDTSTLTYTTNATATVSVTVHDSTGVQLAELAPATRLTSGAHTIGFDGLDRPDGRYTS